MKKIVQTFIFALIAFLAKENLYAERIEEPTPCLDYPLEFDCCEPYWQFGLGIMYDEKIDGMLPYATLLWERFTFGFGCNGVSADNDDASWSEVYFVGHAGLRFGLCDCAFFTIGASGSVGHSSLDEHVTPYVIGPFVGLDFHITNHLMLTAQILPYNYEREKENVIEHEYFQEGMIGLSWMF